MTPTRLPVVVLTGFLGSGKTTLLNRLLASAAFADSAVVINEFGETGIDHLLVTAPVEGIYVLDNGCVCCTARGELAGTLRRLVAQRAAGAIPAFARVLVETTGLADPVPVLETLTEDPTMVELFTLDSVVTMVDGVNGAAQLDEYGESVRQVAVADRLLVSKTDLADAPVIDALVARLRSINPGAPVGRVVTADIDPLQVLRPASAGARPTGEAFFDWLTEAAHCATRTVIHAPHSHGDAERDTEGPGVRTFTLWYEQPVTRAGLVLWLDQLAGLRGQALLRVKGVLNVEGEPVAIHAVQRIVHEPEPLAGWADGERRSRIVFITRGLGPEVVEPTLPVLSFVPPRPAGGLIDAEAYARFVAAARTFR
jgi:G3E family GTPase